MAEVFGKSKDHNDVSANLHHILITSSIKLAAEVDIVGNGEGEDAIVEDDTISASVQEAAEVVANEFDSGIVDVEPSDAALVENQQSKPQDNDSPSSFKKDNQFNNSFPNTQLYTQMVADMSSTIATMEEKSRSTCDKLLDLLSLVSNYASVGTSDHGDDHL